MEAIENALQGQLAQTIERLKGVGGAVYFEGDSRRRPTTRSAAMR